MNLLDQLSTVTKNLASLGQGKLIALAFSRGGRSRDRSGCRAFTSTSPRYETLYVGLESSDLNQISIALAEANIDFEVGSDGSSLQVPVGMTGKARLYLAERGLPNSANAGYELFDNVGSLGLTSFMQEVTRVRALEGEIARTIQQISGIAAARVHIVMADRRQLPKGRTEPDGLGHDPRQRQLRPQLPPASIRHLVASSVPGLEIDDVTILDSAGQLACLRRRRRPTARMNRSLGIVQNVQQEIEINIDKALGALPRHGQLPRQRHGQAQHRHPADPGNGLRSGIKRRTLGPRHQGRAEVEPAAARQCRDRPAERSAGGPDRRRHRPAVAGQADKKEEQTNYEINRRRRDRQEQLHAGEAFGRRRRQQRPHRRRWSVEPADQAKIDAYIPEMQKIVASAAGSMPRAAMS